MQPLSGELLESSTNLTEEARCDISARSFWQAGQIAFLDVRVFNPMASRYLHLESSKRYEVNEREKKRQYNERVMEIEHGTFTPLVMSATGGMGRESRKFYSRLTDIISEIRKQNRPIISAWIKRKIIFSLVKSVGVCIRGSRSITPDRNLENSIDQDIDRAEETSETMSRIN